MTLSIFKRIEIALDATYRYSGVIANPTQQTGRDIELLTGNLGPLEMDPGLLGSETSVRLKNKNLPHEQTGENDCPSLAGSDSNTTDYCKEEMRSVEIEF